MSSSPEQREKGLVRRRILEVAGTAALGIGVVTGVPALLWEALRQHSKRETIIDFSTDTVEYRLLGGAHGSPNIPENQDVVTVLRRETVPEDVTVFELETGTLPYLSPQFYPIINRVYSEFHESDFLKEVMPVLTGKRLPLVLTDVPTSLLDPEPIITIGGSAGFTAIGLFGGKDKNQTRRKFLQRGGLAGVGALLARSLSNDVLSYLNRSVSEPWVQRLARINHYVELSKPDSLITTFRNTIIAAKTLGLEDSFPNNPVTGKPKALLIYGSRHWGIPEYLKSGKHALLNYLSLYPRPFVDALFGNDNPHLYTSATITPQGNDLRIEKIEDRDLKHIFK